jgi:hypothetical protein
MFYVTFIEQKGECILRYFGRGRPCDEFAERVWPFSSFLLSTALQYLMIPREEVELDDVTSYNIFDNKIYKISS